MFTTVDTIKQYNGTLLFPIALNIPANILYDMVTIEHDSIIIKYDVASLIMLSGVFKNLNSGIIPNMLTIVNIIDVINVKVMVNATDIFNALMAFPNLIALIALSPVVFAETKAFFGKQKAKVKSAEVQAN